MCKLNKTNKGRRMDPCMKPIIKIISQLMGRANIPGNIVACCCGHNKYPMTIIIQNIYRTYELFTGNTIPRKRRFYLKDKQGFYYIPEALK